MNRNVKVSLDAFKLKLLKISAVFDYAIVEEKKS
jgi:hypothetical protein